MVMKKAFTLEYTSVEKVVAKGNRRRSIGYCPHLWESPLQPFQPAQHSPRLSIHHRNLQSAGTLIFCIAPEKCLLSVAGQKCTNAFLIRRIFKCLLSVAKMRLLCGFIKTLTFFCVWLALARSILALKLHNLDVKIQMREIWYMKKQPSNHAGRC